MQQGANEARSAYEQGVETARENANDAQKAANNHQ